VELKAQKVVSSLPTTLEADTIYFVRVGAGFDLYVTNASGLIVAYPLNASGGGFLPVTIGAGQQYTIPANQQAISGTDITVDGTLTIDGIIIEA
jgi:hypothetical protein